MTPLTLELLSQHSLPWLAAIGLPLAHPVAPTPASAVLSGTMIKVGLLGWLRFLPLGEAALPAWGMLCVIAGLVAAFYAVGVGLTQENPKTILAYSSVSQMGFITLAIGMGLLAPEAWPLALVAVLLYAMHHALAKGALFLGVGVAQAAGRDRRQFGFVLVGLLVPALALAGAPLTSGAAAKLALKSATVTLPAPWPEWLGGLLPLAAIGTTLLMGRFLWMIWPSSKTEGAHLRLGLWLPWGVLVVVVALSPWLLAPAVHQWLPFSFLGEYDRGVGRKIRASLLACIVQMEGRLGGWAAVSFLFLLLVVTLFLLLAVT